MMVKLETVSVPVVPSSDTMGRATPGETPMVSSGMLANTTER